jgi:hypothetical protein
MMKNEVRKPVMRLERRREKGLSGMAELIREAGKLETKIVMTK